MSTGYVHVDAPHALPTVGHTVAIARRPLRFMQDVQESGDVVSLRVPGATFYAVTHPDLIRQMLVNRDEEFAKGRFYDQVRPLAGNGIVLAEGDEHRRQQRIVKPAFARPRLHDYAVVMDDVIDQRLGRWQDGQVVHADAEMHAITLNILAQTMFGAHIDDRTLQELTHLLPEVLRAIMVRSALPNSITRLLVWQNKKFETAMAELRSSISSAVRRARSGEAGTDLLSQLAVSRHEDTGELLSDAEITDQIVAMMMAGSETAATQMAWLTYELGRDPKTVLAVREELTGQVPDRTLEAHDLSDLPWLHSTLKEGLRRRQPILVMSRRSTRDLVFAEREFDAATEFFFSPYALFRDPRYFPDPLTFRPERWLDSPADSLSERAFVPFGGGPRHCVGEQFAWAMMGKIVAEMIRRFDFDVVGDEPAERAWATINPSEVRIRLTRVG